MTMMSWKEIMKAMSHGTKRSPAHWKILRKMARKGAPRTKATAQDLKRSVMKILGVVLLKPCFSSRTKVPYQESGNVGIVDKK